MGLVRAVTPISFLLLSTVSRKGAAQCPDGSPPPCSRATARALSALGSLSFLARDYRDSQRWLDSSLRVNPEFYLGYVRRARTRVALADLAGARADAEMALRVGGIDSAAGEALLAMAYAKGGDTVTARALVSRILRAFPDTIWEPLLEERLLPAVALATLGDREGTLTLLEHARPRGARLWSGLRAPEFDSLRAEPRFQRLVDESRPL